MEKNRDTFFLPEKKLNHSNKQEKIFFYENDRRNNKFDKNRPGLQKEKQNDDSKKPFDKKAYRLKKYSKKYKLEQWEEQRKKKLLRNYYKEMKNDSVSGTYKAVKFDKDNVDSNQESIGKYVRHPDLIENPDKPDNKESNVKKDPYWKSKEKLLKIKQDKLDKQKEIEKAKEEKIKKLQEYKKKKQERYKKLSKKTKKGQPVMTGRLELLLEKLQNK